MKYLKVYCILDDITRKDFFNSLNFKQKEIANIINSWQGNVSKTMKGIHNLTIEQIFLLQNRNNFSVNRLKKGIKNLRVGSLTEINDKKFKDFMFDFKK